MTPEETKKVLTRIKTLMDMEKDIRKEIKKFDTYEPKTNDIIVKIPGPFRKMVNYG